MREGRWVVWRRCWRLGGRNSCRRRGGGGGGGGWLAGSGGGGAGAGAGASAGAGARRRRRETIIQSPVEEGVREKEVEEEEVVEGVGRVLRLLLSRAASCPAVPVTRAEPRGG